MSWNTKLFAFALFGFLVYIFVTGDQSKWIALFTQSATS